MERAVDGVGSELEGNICDVKAVVVFWRIFFVVWAGHCHYDENWQRIMDKVEASAPYHCRTGPTWKCLSGADSWSRRGTSERGFSQTRRLVIIRCLVRDDTDDVPFYWVGNVINEAMIRQHIKTKRPHGCISKIKTDLIAP